MESEMEEWEKVYDHNMKTYIVDTKKDVFYRKTTKRTKENQFKPIEKLELVRKEYIEYMKQFNNENKLHHDY